MKNIYEFITAMLDDGHHFVTWREDGISTPYLAWGIMAPFRQDVERFAACYDLETKETPHLLYWEVPVTVDVLSHMASMHSFPNEVDPEEDEDEEWIYDDLTGDYEVV